MINFQTIISFILSVFSWLLSSSVAKGVLRNIAANTLENRKREEHRNGQRQTRSSSPEASVNIHNISVSGTVNIYGSNRNNKETPKSTLILVSKHI